VDATVEQPGPSGAEPDDLDAADPLGVAAPAGGPSWAHPSGVDTTGVPATVDPDRGGFPATEQQDPAGPTEVPSTEHQDPAGPTEVPSREHPGAVDTTEVTAAFDRRRTVIGAIVTVGTLAVVFLGIIPRFGSYADAWAEVQQMSGSALVALGLSVLVMVLVYVLPYQAAIPGLRFRPAFIIRQTSFAISNGVPAGGAVGVALQYAMLASYAVPVAAATAGIAVTSLWSMLMTLTLPVFGILAALAAGTIQERWVWVALIGAVATVLTVVALWLILRSEASARRLGAWGDRLLEPVNRRRANPLRATGMVLDLRTTTVAVLSRHWAWVTVSNYLVVLAQFGVLWFAIRGVGGSGADGLTLAEGFAAFAISRMASMIPITPGGLGTVDAALIALLVGFGLPEATAIAATLVWRAASFVPQVSLGVLTFVWWRVEVGRAARAGTGASRA
jgi:uncharacterized protein (TIRG00374 family)